MDGNTPESMILPLEGDASKMTNGDELVTEMETVSATGSEFVDLKEEDSSEVSSEEISEESATAEDKAAQAALTPEEYDKYMEMVRKISFRTRTVARASKAEKKEMFAEEHIVAEDTVQIKSDAKKLKEDMTELTASARTQSRILEGIIDGFRYIDSNADIRPCMATVSYGNGTCKVLIPDYVLFNFNFAAERTEDLQHRIENRIRRMIGAKINSKMVPITTPLPIVATLFSSVCGIAPTTAPSPISTFSATIQCFTTAPAFTTVPPMITASSTIAPSSTLTPANKTECFTLP